MPHKCQAITKHVSPKQMHLLIDNDYWDSEKDRFIHDGTIIIRLSDYSRWCSNSFPIIHRCSTSLTVLKKYKRNFDFKEKQNANA